MEKAGVRFNRDYHIFVDMEEMKILKETNEGVTEYSIRGGSSIERKRLYDNPDTSVQMTTDTLFMESEIEGYQYLAFTVTNTSGDYEVEEWCEIAPLKAHSGQFVISLPVTNALYVRKIYRSSGAVKPSASVYEIGKTTEDRNNCIVKSVDAVKEI